MALWTPGLGASPACQQMSTSFRIQLCTPASTVHAFSWVSQDAVSPIRPTIWASAYGDEHSGIRRLALGSQAAISGPARAAGAARALPGQRSSRPLIRRSLDASLPHQTAAAAGQGSSAACQASGA